MYAVIETGGKQYRVQEGDVISIEKLNIENGNAVEFDKVLLLSDGNDVQVGAPYLSAAKVYGSVVESGKGKKVIIFKYKSKKDYRKKQGHRQPYTMVQIDGVSADGTAPVKKAVIKKTEETVDIQDEEKKAPAIKSMKKDELITFAKENGIEIDEKATKSVIIETVEAAMK